MTGSQYLKNFAESFAIFAKYKAKDVLDLDYNSIGVYLAEEVSPEDEARLLELGWEKAQYGGYIRGNEHKADYA